VFTSSVEILGVGLFVSELLSVKHARPYSAREHTRRGVFRGTPPRNGAMQRGFYASHSYRSLLYKSPVEISGVGLPLLELLKFKHGQSYAARAYSAKVLSSTPYNGKNFRLKIGPIESNKHRI